MNIYDWEKKVDVLFKKRNLHPEDIKNDLNNTFYHTLKNDGWYEHSKNGDGFKMLDVLMNDEFLATLWDNNVRTSLYDVIPELSDNKTFRNIVARLARVSNKGTGVGEILWMLLFKNSEHSTHDIFTSGKAGEAKKFDGGCLKSTDVARFLATDKAREKYFDGVDLFYNGRTKKIISENTEWWNKNGDSKKVRGYFSEVYPMLSDSELDEWTNIFMDSIGDSKKLNNAIGMKIYNLYKDIDGFDFFVLINPTKNLDLIYIVDMDDTDFVMNNISFKVMGSRGADTNALGDGYAKIKGVNIK